MKFLVLLMISLSSFASEQRIYSFGDLMVAFEQADNFLVNRACEDKKCEAFLNAKKYSHKVLNPGLLEGGKNPASVKCKTLMNGKVLIGVDLDGHEQSVCHFKDDSYLILNF